MFSLLRNRFGIPGVISVFALVFAMIGGAYAASDGGSGGSKASASAKAKKGPRGPRGPKGPPGPAGPAGPQGPAGPAGAKGADGAQGPKGDTGPTGPTGPKGATGDEGPEGSPWSAGGLLPSGETLTGSWSSPVFEGKTPETTEFVSASFPIPLEDGLPASNAHTVMPGEESPPAQCSGSAAEPTADAGHFCVYGAFFQNTTFLGVLTEGLFPSVAKPSSSNPFEPTAGGTGMSGALILLVAQGESSDPRAYGTWAVTAP